MIINVNYFMRIKNDESDSYNSIQLEISHHDWKKTQDFVCSCFTCGKYIVTEEAKINFPNINSYIFEILDTTSLSVIIDQIKSNLNLSGEWNRYTPIGKEYMIQDTLEPSSFNQKIPEYIGIGNYDQEKNVTTYFSVYISD